MTTLLVLHLGSKGAGPRMLHDFAVAARDDGTEVVLAYYGGCELASDLEAIGAPALAAPASTHPGALGALQRIASNVGYAFALRRFARRHDVGAAYAVMDSPLQLLPTALLRLSGIPVLGSAHDADRHAGEESHVMEAIMWLRPHAYSGLMTYSTTVAALMRARVRHPERIFETVHGAYGSTGPPPEARAAAPSPAVVGFFGRILRYKGLERLADAIVALRAEGRKVELRVHGRGEVDDHLATRLAAAGASVDNRWVDETAVADLVASFDVVAIPYSEASQSGIVGYAMNAAVPVVATPLPGLVEQVARPAVGVVAEDMSPGAFAAAIARLLDDAGLYASLSANGPAVARSQFAWNRVVRDVRTATDALRDRSERGPLAAWQGRLLRSRRTPPRP